MRDQSGKAASSSRIGSPEEAHTQMAKANLWLQPQIRVPKLLNKDEHRDGVASTSAIVPA
jgi:hypothetical protein